MFSRRRQSSSFQQLWLWTLLLVCFLANIGAEAPDLVEANNKHNKGFVIESTSLNSTTTTTSIIQEEWTNSSSSSANTGLVVEEEPITMIASSRRITNRVLEDEEDQAWCHWQSLFWAEMDKDTREALMALNETEDTWNNCMIVETWNLEWLELNSVQRDAALDLGFNPTRWYNAGFFSCDWECLTGNDEDDLFDSITAGEDAPCLSETTLVRVLDKGDVLLKDVKLGDKILVSSSSSHQKYQEVYSFGHKDVYAVGDFLQITTRGSHHQPLEITGDHLIMKQISFGTTSSGVPVRADSIQVGDFLIGDKGVRSEVIEISSIKRAGLYSPLTKDGILVANGIVVSSYTALQDQNSQNFILGEEAFAAISHHLLSHSAMAPFRTMMMMYTCSGFFSYYLEQRNDDGQLLFAMEGKTIVDWTTTNPAELQFILFLFLLGNLFSFYVMEQIFGGVILISTSAALFTWILSRRLSRKLN